MELGCILIPMESPAFGSVSRLDLLDGDGDEYPPRLREGAQVDPSPLTLIIISLSDSCFHNVT